MPIYSGHMPTIDPPSPPAEPHRARRMAESFGVDAERYDRTRPRYPQALADRIVAASPGRHVLDVGIGTGISALAFRAAGCRVLGVDPDERMAELARRRGFEVESAKFEEWDPVRRTFDVVIAGQTWHWVDPVAGAKKAAEVLRPGGRLAVFWNAMELPSELADATTRAFRSEVTDSPSPRDASTGQEGYSVFFERAAAGIRKTGAFDDPEQWRVDWVRSYSKEEWLDVMPTGGGFNLLTPDQLEEVLGLVGDVIDEMGGSFRMGYAAVAVTAARRS